MGGEIILYVFIFIVVLLIFLEYRNEKKYQEQRRKRRQEQTHKKKSTPSQAPKKVTPRAEPKAEVKPAPKPEPKPEVKIEPKPEPKPEPKLEPKIEAVKETKKLPEANYPKFTHIRLVEMGLSDEEAKEFVAELIPQIEEQFPLIEKALHELDFHQIERLTHGIKGSATNLGTGGVSDLLVDYNTYLKTGTDIDIARAYFEHLEHYNNELKAQYA
jgi:HPt (histidine-containing phosphotransfer) domain-containing protein